MARQADRSASTIRRLLDTAARLFAGHGYDDVSIDLIAAEAGVTKGGFYHHFPSKQALFERVLDEAQAQIADQLSQASAAAPAQPPAASLVNGAVGYLRLANGPDVRRVVLLDGPRVLGWARWREIDDRHFAGRVREALVHILGATADEALVDTATRVVLGAIMEAAIASGAAASPDDVVAQFGRTLEAMLAGLSQLRAQVTYS